MGIKNDVGLHLLFKREKMMNLKLSTSVDILAVMNDGNIEKYLKLLLSAIKA